MNTRNLRDKLLSIARCIFQHLRILKYKLLSDVQNVESSARIRQPVLMTGKGEIRLGRCYLGFWPSSHFFDGYTHIEARESTARIVVEDGVQINNNATLVAERTTIRIGANTLIGTEFTVYDSDFHDTNPEQRMSNTHTALPVIIGRNVFIGSRVAVLKGVTIGDNAVIGCGQIVRANVPANAVIKEPSSAGTGSRP